MHVTEDFLNLITSSGFAAFAKARQFGTYVDYVIAPSYDLHQTMGLLKYTMSGEKLEQQMSFRNFLSGRILWDEAMASTAYEWTRKNNGGLLVGLVGADHGKSQREFILSSNVVLCWQ